MRPRPIHAVKKNPVTSTATGGTAIETYLVAAGAPTGVIIAVGIVTIVGTAVINVSRNSEGGLLGWWNRFLHGSDA